jgi:ribosomal protein L19E
VALVVKDSPGGADIAVMLKKIPVERLTPGMYVHDLGVAWADHPFMPGRFELKSESQIAELATAGLHAVCIDTEKGDDVHDAPTAADVRAQVDAPMQAMVTPMPAHVSVSEEIQNARVLHQRAGVVARDVMRDGRLGKAVQAENVAALVDDITQSAVRNSGALLAMLRLKNKDDYRSRARTLLSHSRRRIRRAMGSGSHALSRSDPALEKTGQMCARTNELEHQLQDSNCEVETRKGREITGFFVACRSLLTIYTGIG